MDPTYTFQTFDDRVDHVTPRFNNLLGINNLELIAGFYGSGSALTPNGMFTPENFLESPRMRRTFATIGRGQLSDTQSGVVGPSEITQGLRSWRTNKFRWLSVLLLLNSLAAPLDR